MGKEAIQSKRKVRRPREIPRRYQTKGQREWYRVLRRMMRGKASRLAMRVMRNLYYGNSQSSSAPVSQQSVPSSSSREATGGVRTTLRRLRLVAKRVPPPELQTPVKSRRVVPVLSPAKGARSEIRLRGLRSDVQNIHTVLRTRMDTGKVQRTW